MGGSSTTELRARWQRTRTLPLSSSEIRRCHRHTPRERTQRPRGDVKASSTWSVCSTRSPRSSAHSTFLRSFMGFLRSFMGWFANGARLLCPYCFSWYFSRCFSRHTNISDESPRCHSPKPTCRSIHARQEFGRSKIVFQSRVPASRGKRGFELGLCGL